MFKKLAFTTLSFLISCNVFQPPPDLAWNDSPEALIIRTESDGGMEPQAAHYNRIPNAQVWGDGRIVWQTSDENGVRQVWQGQLSKTEMTTLLQTFADKGFWRLKQHYEPKDDVYDSRTTSLRVSLLDDYKVVSQYHSGAPKAFHELVGLLRSGAGVEGKPYVPQTGYLTLYPIDPQHELNDVLVWDAEAANISLEAVEDGWVEGDLLLQAWDIVNQRYWSPLVVDEGAYYEIHLQMPELTGRDPS